MSQYSILLKTDGTYDDHLQLDLTEEGFLVEKYSNYDKLYQAILSKNNGLIVVDRPQNQKLLCDFLNKIHDNHIKIPIIQLLAFYDSETLVKALDNGSHDVLIRPFVLAELRARIQNLLRIFWGEFQPTIEVGDLYIYSHTRSAERAGKHIEFTKTEFNLLYYLAQRKNQVCSREQLLADIWGYNFKTETNIVDVYIRYLREKIDKGHRQKLIRTIRSLGYKLRDPLFK